MFKVNVIITTCNWFDNIWNIVNWLDKHKDNFQQVLIVDNSTDDKSREILEDLSKVSFIKVIKNPVVRNLRNSLYLAATQLQNDLPILTIESDAIPDIRVFEKLFHYYLKFNEKERIASIGPFYQNNGIDCYPVHKHWYADKVIYSSEDEIRDCGGAGNPFLFSLWNQSAFSEIANLTKNFIGVDTELSKITFELGFKHLRLSNMRITHLNGGKNSHG